MWPPAHLVFFITSVEDSNGVTRWAHNLAKEFDARGVPTSIVGVKHVHSPVRYESSPRTQTHTLTSAQAATGRTRKLKVTAARILNHFDRFRGAHRLTLRDLPQEGRRQLDRLLNTWPTNTVIICTNPTTAMYVHLAEQRGARRHTLLAQHHSSFDAIRGTVQFHRLLAVADRLDMFVALTEEDAEGFETLGLRRVTAIPNPSPPAARDCFQKDRADEIVMMGRLSPEKNHVAAIRAWKQVAAKHPEWRLSIYGEGETKKLLQWTIRSLHLEQSVALCGRTENPIAAQSHAKATLLTSLWEGWPLAIAEAASSGTPAIATSVSPGIRALVRPGETGLLIREMDLASISSTILEFIEDPALQECLARGAWELSRHYDIGRIVSSWREVIQSAQQNHLADE